ncbi:MAG: TIGR03067 domain-containing protein [Planctomycetaceae bacterium]
MPNYYFLTLLLCLTSMRVVANDDGKSPQTDKESIETAEFRFDGVWKPKGAMLGGVLLPPEALEVIALKIEKDHYEVTIEGEDHSDSGTFTLDETVTPKRMTIKSESGPNKGKTFLAIFEVKSVNAMRVCYDLSGKEFPKEFKAPKDTELYLVGYRRQTSESPDRAKAPDETKGKSVPVQ